MSIPKLHKQRTSRLDNRETPDTIQSAKQERSRRSIALYNNRIFTEEKNNIRVQFLLTSANCYSPPWANEKSRRFLIGLAGELLHRSYSNEDVAKSSVLFQILFFIQKGAIAS